MRKAMNSICRNLLGLLALLLALPLHAAPVTLDRIVAVVNNGIITEHELRSRVASTLQQLALQRTPAPPRHLLERQLLERMITERILLQMAEDTNIRIDGPQLDRALTRLAWQNNMELDQFRRALEQDGVDFNAFREQVRTEMIIGRLREREVDNRVVVTEAEIDNYLANPSLDQERKNEYLLAHILVTTPEGASPEQLQALRAKADKALAELRAGADFGQVSASYSDAQNALQGGVLGWRNEAQLPTLFVTAVRDLPPGGVTPVLRSSNGYHILKVLDKRGKDVSLVVRQTRARHILVRTNEIVGDNEARNRLRQLRERIVHGADFAELARLHSDDLTASKGGDLGWLSPGDTVPEFERTMDGLRPGEVSAPIQTPFGWHLIQVLERRDQDVTQERRRFEARQAIRTRKAEEAFEDWVRQMRDRAYVEYRLEE
jgi:peptidyl-prolyl cis-trans isomerase SurA